MNKDQTLSTDNETASLRDRFINAIIENGLKPTHYITVNFHKSRNIHNARNVRSDDIILMKAHCDFMRSLSKRCYSPIQWKRTKRIIKSFGVLEGGNSFQVPHAHFVVCKPAHVDEAKFRNMIEQTASKNPWVLRESYDLDIQTLEDRTEVRTNAVRATNYSLKHHDSLDRLLTT